jgi:hypothetical protein
MLFVATVNCHYVHLCIMAQVGPAMMSAIWWLLGGKRTFDETTG